MNILMHRAGSDEVRTFPAEHQQMYQVLGYIYVGPAPEPEKAPADAKPKHSRAKK